MTLNYLVNTTTQIHVGFRIKLFYITKRQCEYNIILGLSLVQGFCQLENNFIIIFALVAYKKNHYNLTFWNEKYVAVKFD